MSIASAESVADNKDIFAPIREDYADFDVPVSESYDWLAIQEELRVPIGQKVVLYAFRSEQDPDFDVDLLEDKDKEALNAAEESGGLIRYEPNPGLSWCEWADITSAEAATSTEKHREAAQYASRAYFRYQLWRYNLCRTTVEVKFSDEMLLRDWSRFNN